MSGLIKHWHHLSLLSIEATHVIWLRSWKLAWGGPSAVLESAHIVAEKTLAPGQTAARLTQGKTPLGMIIAYRREVRANLRRLSK